MFGDKEILGVATVKLDPKGRVCLPSFTNKESKDKLIITEFGTNQMCIYKYDNYIEKLKKLKEKLELSKEASEVKKNELEMYLTFKRVLKVLTVDVHGRVLIGDLFDGIEYLDFIGVLDSVIIEPSKKI